MEGRGPYRIYDPGGGTEENGSAAFERLMEENARLKEKMQGIKSIGNSIGNCWWTRFGCRAAPASQPAPLPWLFKRVPRARALTRELAEGLGPLLSSWGALQRDAGHSIQDMPVLERPSPAVPPPFSSSAAFPHPGFCFRCHDPASAFESCFCSRISTSLVSPWGSWPGLRQRGGLGKGGEQRVSILLLPPQESCWRSPRWRRPSCGRRQRSW